MKSTNSIVQDILTNPDAETLHQEYIKTLRGKTPNDWKYFCIWMPRFVFIEICEILGKENKISVFSTKSDYIHATFFVSPIGIELLKKYRNK